MYKLYRYCCVKKRNNKYFWTFYGNKYLTIPFSLVNFYKVSDIASCYWLLETDILQSLDLKEKGFALLCVAYPKSDLHIVIGDDVEDNLYNDQFGKYQK